MLFHLYRNMPVLKPTLSSYLKMVIEPTPVKLRLLLIHLYIYLCIITYTIMCNFNMLISKSYPMNCFCPSSCHLLLVSVKVKDKACWLPYPSWIKHVLFFLNKKLLPAAQSVDNSQRTVKCCILFSFELKLFLKFVISFRKQVLSFRLLSVNVLSVSLVGSMAQMWELLTYVRNRAAIFHLLSELLLSCQFGNKSAFTLRIF